MGYYERKPVGKRLRFSIFERDGFVCYYCGARPPEVELHIDHIRPVVAGGTNDPDNLVAACADCNLGKAARLLSEAKYDSDYILGMRFEWESLWLLRLEDEYAQLSDEWMSRTHMGFPLSLPQYGNLTDEHGFESVNHATCDVAGEISRGVRHLDIVESIISRADVMFHA